jgi:hypothetical protein
MFTGDHLFFLHHVGNAFKKLDVVVKGLPRQHLDVMMTKQFAAEHFWQPDGSKYTKEEIFHLISDIDSHYMRDNDPLSVTNDESGEQ